MANWKTYGLDNDTKRYLDAVAMTGGSISYGTAQAVNGFVETCKYSGVWDKLTDVGIFVGNDLNTALVKLKWGAGVTPYLTNIAFVEADYRERGAYAGLTGNGSTKSLDSQFTFYGTQNPDSIHLAAYIQGTPIIGGDDSVISAVTSFALSNGINLKYRDNSLRYQYSPDAGANSYLGMTSNFLTGFFIGQGSQAARQVYGNGLILTSATASAGPTTGAFSSSFQLFGDTRVGAAAYWGGCLSFYSIGTNLSSGDANALSMAVNSLQSALGRNLY